MQRKIAILLVLCAGVALARNPGDPLKPGFNLYSKQQDIDIGKQAAAEVRDRYQQVQDPQLRAYINAVGERLAKTPTVSASGYPFSFTLLNYKEVNAFALPGGPTFVFTGLLKTADSEAEVAGVLAHELSHVVLRHGTHRMSKANVIKGPAEVIALLNSFTLLGQIANIGLGVTLNGIFLKNSREDESEADALGTHIMAEAGYDPIAMARFFEKLEQQGGPGVPEFLSDHPSPGNRVEAVQAEARTLPHRTYTYDNAAFERVKVAIAKLPAPPDFRPASIGVEAATATGYKKLSTPQFSVEYPSSWSVQGDSESNMLAMAPKDGIVIGTNGQPAIALGAVISYFFSDPDRSSLNLATSDLIQRLRSVDPGIRDSGAQKSIDLDREGALLTQFTSDSPFGGSEKDLLVTVARPEGLFYLVFISPDKNWSETQPSFDHMVESIRFSNP
jgi:beta-barrel assembly-enhancing protease